MLVRGSVSASEEGKPALWSEKEVLLQVHNLLNNTHLTILPPWYHNLMPESCNAADSVTADHTVCLSVE